MKMIDAASKCEAEHDAEEKIEKLAVNELRTNTISSNEGSLSNFEVPDIFTIPVDCVSIAGNLKNSEDTNEENAFAAMRRYQTQIPMDNVEIKLLDAPSHLKSAEICIEFKKTEESWISAVYRTYENDFWCKIKREDCKHKWHYFCNFCKRRYCSFPSLKGHLNEHLGLFPFKCKTCLKVFTLRHSLITHLRCVHRYERREYEHYVTY
uniref:C2H2-type domain-containing protein n=1 Tax=Glossina palpalis gambiensis TaxID=67801 RepID=A0A1B0ARW8_9MUSC